MGGFATTAIEALSLRNLPGNGDLWNELVFEHDARVSPAGFADF